MRSVDFTPQWYLDVRHEHRSSRSRVIGLLVVLALLITCSVLADSDSRAARADLTVLRQSYHAQAGLVERLDELDRKHSVSAHQSDLLDDAGGGVTVAQIFRELAQLMPEELSIRRVVLNRSLRFELKPEQLAEAPKDIDPPPDLTRLEISGFSQKGRDIGSLVSQMSRSPLFFDVQLRYERSNSEYGVEVVEFVVDCKMPVFE
ncbi:MAG: hypothetical protein DHS20C16_30080 [Phycisphaerae bacterium]|nr:MAG: hypothetical protein DHS20C16_30080 [Phycisphaerae bacterium]